MTQSEYPVLYGGKTFHEYMEGPFITPLKIGQTFCQDNYHNLQKSVFWYIPCTNHFTVAVWKVKSLP